ncbi:hypothetical protein GHA01_26540 [Novacetimonas hansenii]|uniref:Uncharacterized protein n=1 Tax=Novacetimonas hansenii TaxID=436 RepID=A0ABQ0SJ03_NOVHA|nr:hypothetical protein Gaha_0011_004 [Novacetimonas hansenii JCM 7643]GEC64805.1 hypothetical protein GHA01_26540 [Novacetimonas hansenii]
MSRPSWAWAIGDVKTAHVVASSIPQTWRMRVRRSCPWAKDPAVRGKVMGMARRVIFMLLPVIMTELLQHAWAGIAVLWQMM